DMSPHNIFLTFDGQAKTIDFGIVKTTETQHTEVGVFKGKVAYMPPEQASPNMVVDRRADIYSVGVILFEALTGRRLWQGMQEVHILASLLQGDIPTIDKVKPSVPAELRRICNKAMAWDREERYATAEEFREDIEQYFTDTGLSVNMRDVGGLLARNFETERAKMKQLVDRKIAQLKAGGDESPLSIAPPPVRLSIEAPPADQSGSISGFYEEKAITEEKPKLLAVVDDEHVSELTYRKTRLRDFAPQLIALGAIVITSALLLLFVVPSSSSSDATTDPGAVASTSASAAPSGPSPAPQTVDIEIQVTPPNATVVIDDVTLTGNPPYSVHYKKGGASHVAKAMADGYIAKEQPFTVDRDLLLDLSLAPLPPPPVTVRVGSRTPPPHSTATTPPPPTVTQTPPPPTTSKPQPTSTVRPIETSSPYGN
ncbi:MAG TPA: serine/threonine-protein kinase, partial [Polyangiaceae bacterium]